MVKTSIDGIRIDCIASAVSNDWVEIKDLMKANGQEELAEAFSKKTGVIGRYNAGREQTTSDFCCVAAREILNAKSIKPEDIGILVFITQTPDYATPATACVLQNRLGLSANCIAFDVNLGCSGFTYGLNIVSSLLKTSSADKALLLCGDTSAKEIFADIKTKDENSSNYLFGDSGTATLLVKDSSSPTINMVSKTDGEGYKAIIIPYSGWKNPTTDAEKSQKAFMDDVAVFSFAINEVPALLNDTMSISNRKPEDYAGLVLHQANLFIMKTITKRAKFDKSQMLVSIDEFANTSSASIPNTIVKMYGESGSEDLIRLLCCGFGVGLSWSTADICIRPSDVLPLIHTDEYFVDDLSSLEE